jgi:hypothetical protein
VSPYTPDSFIGNDALGNDGNPWDDLQGDISQATAATALTYEDYRDTPFKMYFFKNNGVDALYMRFQMPHAWAANTEVIPHLHVIPMVAPSSSPQNVELTGYYCWCDPNTAAPALLGWTPFTANLSIVTGMEFKPTYVNLFSSTPTGKVGSAFLLVYVQRDGGSGGDTYTTDKSGGTVAANLGLVSLDCHIQKNKQGSPTAVPIA